VVRHHPVDVPGEEVLPELLYVAIRLARVTSTLLLDICTLSGLQGQLR
jgi:hypothetical protein